MNPYFSKLLVACSAMALITSVSAQDAPETSECYGFEVLDYFQGQQTNGNDIADDRSDPEVVIGAPALDNSAGSFFSLGVGGFIDIGFDGVVMDEAGDDILVVETSFSGDLCGFGDDEFADIYLTQNGIDWVYYGEICRDQAIDIATPANEEDDALEFVVAIRIANSSNTPTFDGYDVDGVVAINGCQDFPDTQGCFGNDMLLYDKGTGNIAMNRQNPLQALGAPERNSSQGAMNFVSLGFGGTLIIGFEESAVAGPGVDDLEIVETTWGSPACLSYEERADLYVSQQVLEEGDDVEDVDDWVFVGQSCTNGASFDVYEATGGWEYFTMVKIVDASPVFGNRDGYDVDGIVALLGCAPVPELDLTPGDCNAVDVLEYNPTPSASNISVNRTNPEEALGAPEGDDTMNFVSLGFGGSLVLGFDGTAQIGDGYDLEVVETTFGNQTFASYAESAEIFVSKQILTAEDNVVDHTAFVSVGTALTNGGFFDLSSTGWSYFTLVKIVDNTPESAQFSNRDGFDVDGIVALKNDCRDEEPTPVLDGVQSTNVATRITLDTYPNPTTGPVIIEFTTDNTQRMSVEVIDLSGRVVGSVFNQDANGGQNYRVEFDTSRLTNGIYITKLTSETEVKTKKVIVAR